jgi:hypothetical protein
MRTGVAVVGALFLLVSAGGCGDGAASPDYVEPFGTLKGEISALAPMSGKNVQVALAWYRRVGGEASSGHAGAHAVMESQAVSVSSAFPVSFQLDITELPPADAVEKFTAEEVAQWGLSPDNAYAMGVVLVYDDLNGNGKLDFTPAAAPDLIDKILGHPGDKKGQKTSTYEVFYWEGPAPTPQVWEGDLVGVQPGFNLRYFEIGDEPGVPDVQVVPLDTLLRVQLRGDPKLSCYLVEPLPAEPPGDDLNTPFSPMVFNCVDNLPYADGTPECMGPFGLYMSQRPVVSSPTIEKLCGASVETCMVQAVPGADPLAPFEPPADWPCPLMP